MIKQQQDVVCRKKYTDAVRTEYNKLQQASQLDPEELVRRLKLTVKVPKFHINPNELETIVRDVVGKPPAANDYLLPSSKRARVTNMAAAPAGASDAAFREAEITFHFSDYRLENSEDATAPLPRLEGVEMIQSQLSRRVALFEAGFRSLGKCGMATLVTGERGSGRTSIMKEIGRKIRNSKFLEISCAQIQSCQKPAAALQSLKDFLQRKVKEEIICVFDDIDLLFPLKSSSSSGGAGEKAEGSFRKSSAMLFAFNEIIRASAESNQKIWFLATAVSRINLDPEFLRHGIFGKEILRIPPLEATARRNIFIKTLKDEAAKQGVKLDEEVLTTNFPKSFDNLTRGWTGRQIINTVALTLSRAITDCEENFIEKKLQNPSLAIAEQQRQENCSTEAKNRRRCDVEKTTRSSGDHNPGQPLSGQPLSDQPLSDQPLSGQPLSGQHISISSTDDEGGEDCELSMLRQVVDEMVVLEPPVSLSVGDIEKALEEAAASFAPEGFMDIPSVTMADVGGLVSAKKLVNDYVIEIMKNIELHRSMGFEDSSGILMWGPPGCGKTHLAKAIANACQARFILVKGSELLDKYVGVSEQKVKELFERASDHAPCLIFFDEFDALCPARNQDGLNEVARRVVNSMLIELDGVQKRSGVFVIAATNEPGLIDEAIMRSGRFEHKLYIEPPDEKSRAEIFQVLCRNKPWVIDPQALPIIAKETEQMTGADLKFILNSAALKSWNSSDQRHQCASTDVIRIDLDSLRHSLKLVDSKKKNKSGREQEKLRHHQGGGGLGGGGGGVGGG